MNPISNIWDHPRTSAVGILIAVISVAGVFAQQGVSLGKAGSGTVVSLAGALATALLGLMARDPAAATTQAAAASGCGGNCGGCKGTQSTTAKLGAWMLIALLLPLPWLQGCTATGVAQNIVNWTPALQSAVASVDSTAALLAPADAPAFAAATTGFDAASAVLIAQAKAYLANPTAGALAELQMQVVALEQQVNAALLTAAHISNSASQTHALAALQAVGTIAATILSLVQSVSSNAQVAQMAGHSTIKLAAVRGYLNDAAAAQMVAAHYGEPVAAARGQVTQAEMAEMQAGF